MDGLESRYVARHYVGFCLAPMAAKGFRLVQLILEGRTLVGTPELLLLLLHSRTFFFLLGSVFAAPFCSSLFEKKKDLLVTSKLSKSHPSQQFHNLLLYPFYFNYTIITHVPRNCLPLPCPIRRPKALQRRCNR